MQAEEGIFSISVLLVLVEMLQTKLNNLKMFSNKKKTNKQQCVLIFTIIVSFLRVVPRMYIKCVFLVHLGRIFWCVFGVSVQTTTHTE